MFFKKIINLFYPKICFGCKKEGQYLCADCISTLEILNYQYCLCNSNPKRIPLSILDNGKCPKCKNKNLDGLFFAISYNDSDGHHLIKKMIHNFKYPPLIKDLAPSFSQIIFHYFNLLDLEATGSPKNKALFKILNNFIIIPIPLEKSRERWRGFNQSSEIAKNLNFLNIEIKDNCLIKIKKTKIHSLLSKKEREKNILGSFKIVDKLEIKDKSILLVDDIYTTGATMEECAKILKKDGAKRVFGLVVARSY